MFQGGPRGPVDKRHFAPQIRHHDAHHTTPPPPPPFPLWADPSSQHDCAVPASRCGHTCGSGQARYVQALKDALQLLCAQSIHGGSACHDFPQFQVPQLGLEAGSTAVCTPLTPDDLYGGSISSDDYDFSNSFQFLDHEPSSGDVTMDYYTTDTPTQQPSPSPLLSDSTIIVAQPPPPPPSLPQPVSPPSPPRPEITAGDNARKKRPRISTASDTGASPRPSSSQSPSPQEEAQKPQRPHAAVEKRYRVSLNDKIEALRVCLESRKRPKRHCKSAGDSQATGGGSTDGGVAGGSGGSTPTSSTTTTTGSTTRMSKAEVLTEAVEYVQQLEEENSVMLEQIDALVERMQATQRALQLPSFTAGRN
ncbi:hypothetical protein PG994_013921 [Apiospora phragmitis]|uniref:BHLH domain-containing protein n=1 Tax=Apiospora phragmitis TaxID=2905665 RepID=A0ABR1T2W0_9PEZI